MSGVHVYVIAKSFIVSPEKKVLVLRRSETDTHRPLTWDIPGGSVEQDEDPMLAAKRELTEETGIQVNTLHLVDLVSVSIPAYMLTAIYTAGTDNMTVTLSFEHDSFLWVTKNEFYRLAIPEKYKHAMQLLHGI